MKALRVLGWIGLALAVIIGVGSFPVEQHHRSHAGTYQLVKPSPEAALFGEVGEPIGTPQVYVVFDKAAVLEGDINGVKLLSDDHFKKTGTYPVQMKTVEFLASQVRLGTAVGAVVALGMILFARRKLRTA